MGEERLNRVWQIQPFLGSEQTLSQVEKLRNRDISIPSVRKINYRRLKTEKVRRKLALQTEDGNKKSWVGWLLYIRNPSIQFYLLECTHNSGKISKLK